MPRLLPKRMVLVAGLGSLSLLCLYYYLTLGASLVPDLGAILGTSTSAALPLTHESCQVVVSHKADIETADVFPTLELTPSWMERREYWGSEMEDRFQRRRPLWSQLPLRVIVMPHSHNDPGWLKTVEGYFAASTKNILTNIVNKLTEHKNMTFIWTEMSYLSMWWDAAPPEMQTKLRALLGSGRLEIPTGGWVMTDEANVELFSMIDQLVEGHTFLRNVLDVKPVSSWSVDSFGHGGTFPHILAKSGIENMVIMRIHYAWKEWFARYQQGDFLWKQPWEEDGSQAPLCHNFPYDIYSIKHSCGPHPQTCLGFDFRHVNGEYNEFSAAYNPIDASNLQTRAELLLEQYGRTGSLLPHNVVLVPLGDDFRYNNAEEFDQQYHNYMQLMQFINSHEYNAQVTFGTLTDYFTEVRSRMTKFNTLSGDFFVYSDIFSEGQPAYWSGYYTTRPFLKSLSRQLASKLRAAEIIFSLTVNLARVSWSVLPFAVLCSQYNDLVAARRHLGLFQHHDAITGTSKNFVMQDYQQKLLAGLSATQRVIEVTSHFLLQKEKSNLDLSRPLRHLEWRGEGEQGLEFRNSLDLHSALAHSLVVYNSLMEAREELVTVITNSANVCVRDEAGTLLDVQIAPHYNTSGESRLDFGLFDVWFRASLPPLSLTTFVVTFCDRSGSESVAAKTKVFCMRCPNSESDTTPFSLHSVPHGAVKLENHVYTLMFDPISWLLSTVTNKLSGETVSLGMEFTAYPSAHFRSGAYLFSVDSSSSAETGPVFNERDLFDVLILSGPLFAELTLVWSVNGEGGTSTFVTAVRLQHTTGPQGEAISIENNFDFGPAPNMRDKELVMRFNSGLKNQRRFFTDKSGLGFVRREWSEQAGLEGNLFPITQSTFLQDDHMRLSLLVNHAAGAASVAEGSLEVMLDRRTAYDDARGMGEGVLDSRATQHKFWLLLEPKDPSSSPVSSILPALSPLATVLSRQQEHPPSVLHARRPNTLGLQDSVKMVRDPLPCDLHLLNLRSWEPSQPSSAPQALLSVHRQAPDCTWASLSLPDCLRPAPSPHIHFLQLSASLQPVSLTGNFPANSSQGREDLSLGPMELAAYNVTFV